MQSFSSRIWTRVAVSISYDDNDYTTGTFFLVTAENAVLKLSRYIYFGLVTASNVIPSSLLISPPFAHVVFERSIDRELYSSSVTSSTGRGNSLKQGCWQLKNKNSWLSINNNLLLFIY